jgi:D-serine deaminase-like pyridoxal phosphate-dependent protein
MSAMSLSRRAFLQTAGAGAAAATVWEPAVGREANDTRRFDSSDQSEIGVSKWDLETPALCVDLAALEANLATMQRTLRANGIASRPHAKTHKCPAIARLQLQSGAIGICVAKIGEAEVMFDHGIGKILLTTSNVTPRKIRRAMQLRRWCPEFIQATDTPANARHLSEAALAAGVTADVVVDIDAGSHRTGIAPGRALELAQLVDRLPALRLRGILCYDGDSQHVAGFTERRAQTLTRMAPAAETAAQMRRSGLNTEIFSGGGTGTYNIDHEVSGLTDVQVGSYVFMDAQYLAIGGADGNATYTDFAPSLTIIATVVNAQHEGVATTDAGAKACTINQPWSLIKGETGMTYRSGSDEFGSIRYNSPSRVYAAGDPLELIVSHCDPVINLYDTLYAIRNEKVDAVWSIAARGRST